DNMRKACALLGDPQKDIKAIHVAGTNGKGSVTHKIAASLQNEGYRVGLYTSPHISCYRERIRINGEKITETEVVALLEKILSLGIALTFFECTTLAAFAYFAAAKVDVAVLEVGIGGRLDATNVCSSILTVITSVSLDHTDLLGHTVEEIAREKAGILKPNIPLVIGPYVPREPVERRALELNVPISYVDEIFESYEDENVCVAKKALKVLADTFPLKQQSIVEGLKELPACRFQVLDKDVIFDVAHNVDGVRRLLQRLKIYLQGKPFGVVCGFSRDKEVKECLQLLMEQAQALFFVQAESHRAVPVDELREIAKEIDPTYTEIYEGLQKAQESGTALVVCGTFYIMEECYKFFDKKQQIK
ncbi:MAG: bifunctional folylpolyglutamate synthase/dihydrofolate synthase, partial [Verrucomicrobia bacterium]|nr:bifunctional folylpolyglutamate synthase/dihydrofolate synthase [Verrucomicrobiota bacterium]